MPSLITLASVSLDGDSSPNNNLTSEDSPSTAGAGGVTSEGVSILDDDSSPNTNVASEESPSTAGGATSEEVCLYDDSSPNDNLTSEDSPSTARGGTSEGVSIDEGGELKEEEVEGTGYTTPPAKAATYQGYCIPNDDPVYKRGMAKVKSLLADKSLSKYQRAGVVVGFKKFQDSYKKMLATGIKPSPPRHWAFPDFRGLLYDSEHEDSLTSRSAEGLAGKFFAPQSSIRRPDLNEVDDLNCSKPSHNKRTNAHRAASTPAGAKLVKNQTKTLSKSPGCNDRTCLLDALLSVIPHQVDKHRLSQDIISLMHTQGDTSVRDIEPALINHNLVVEAVNQHYHIKGGAPYHILQERNCRMLILIKLLNDRHQSMFHFVGWDGHTIHDHPDKCCVSDTRDRSTPANAKKAFTKLYSKPKFQSWQIIHVYHVYYMPSIQSAPAKFGKCCLSPPSRDCACDQDELVGVDVNE